jgi:hypothetical protein
MTIRQIQARYDDMNDRVLLRISTADDSEFLFWLTRRFTRGLWAFLLKALEQDDAVKLQADAEARKAVLGMRHEGYLRQNDFSRPFEERQYKRPLGPEPVLVARADYKPTGQPGVFVLSLRPQQGAGVDLNVNASLLHSICKLIHDAVARSDWDLQLVMPRASLEPAVVGEAPRTLN